ncbi:MAG: valine--tRNA ligase [Anaerolineales bacterium]
MPLAKHYQPGETEPRLHSIWEAAGVYHFSPSDRRAIYSIDTPPPTVSGSLHLGHTYSYTHTDVFARYHRMRGENVFYPMGYDDNGLPTERLVESKLGNTAVEIGRQTFIDKCLQISQEIERDYQTLWQRLGLSIDWRYMYRTIDDCSRRTSQLSFIELYQHGLIYRQEAPTIWCPECQTGIAQADVNDLQRQSELVTLKFLLDNGDILPIATTRPELLPACVAVFVNPDDKRYTDIIDHQVSVPLFDRKVKVLLDPAADPGKGTGAVMCCTFGDTIDKHWWYTHQLDHVEAIDRQGRMTTAVGEYAGLTVEDARASIKSRLQIEGGILDRQQTEQIVPVHERCDTPVELIMSQQWFIRILDHKAELLEIGEQIKWHPPHMKNRYRSWVENLAWDWCISRQRYYGIPFPLWYCQGCGEVILAKLNQLPVDPIEESPTEPCQCGSTEFIPERDTLETWATSSLTPQIAGRWLCEENESSEGLYQQVYPFSLRPQAHEIIRSWAFYTIAKSHFHFNRIPWKEIAISGWGIAGEGMGKISKSRGGGPVPPLEMIQRYSADAVRYWAVSTGLGKDAIISEDKIKLGAKLITKLWNVARFSERFLADYTSPIDEQSDPSSLSELPLTPADRWILSRLQQLIRMTTESLEIYEYAAAKSEIENFFWSDFTDNYLEMCKQRLYTGEGNQLLAAQFTLHYVLLTLIKLLAPFLPYLTEKIYQGIFLGSDIQDPSGFKSIHNEGWPIANPLLEDEYIDLVGDSLVEIATAVRRFKSVNSLSLGSELQRLEIETEDEKLSHMFADARQDLLSITRAQEVQIGEKIANEAEPILDSDKMKVFIVN